ncbi:MAG: OB-fold domain-containing protein [Candidatus Tectomicrobia bacterium]|uniref:OB-fold domain-containing protein n=1 Tax=Tectimicrobiota bacterium TaxID=2528274 RepID=A0A933GJS0_UNCTE|nr:OB-fold domain-containing protein [Candidatus Tectomicrobia bacterium]
MIGIISYGAYVPLWRLDRAVIGKEWGSPAMPGEKAVANFDEDSLTMAAAAAMDCLNGLDRKKIDGLFFCSTTSPYEEKQSAVTIAACTDLRKDIITGDNTNSLRASTQALRAAVDSIKAGSAKEILVTAADMRVGAPRSTFEQLFGDAAAAVIIGDSNVAVEIENFYSAYHEISDVWRSEGEQFVKGWEDRFVAEEGYLKSVSQSVAAALKKFNTKPSDYTKAVFYAAEPRRQAEIANLTGFNPKTQMADGLFGLVGNTGAAHPLLMLVAALEDAKAGDRLLLMSYGEGCDVLSLRVTDQIEKIKDRRGYKKLLASKKMIPDYQSYAQWRGILSAEAAARRPVTEAPSSSAQWRERERILRLYGNKCVKCGTVEYPPQRVCARCQSKDNFTDVRLADKKAKLFTYAMDYIAGTKDIPLVVCVLNFDGGGRMICTMTDRDTKEIKIEMPVEMTFRNLFTTEGVRNYYWKCMPVRC